MGLRYDRALGARASLEVYALQQLGDYSSADDLVTASDVTTFKLGKRTGESILRATATYSVSPTLSTQAGLEGDFNWLTSRTSETDARPAHPGAGRQCARHRVARRGVRRRHLAGARPSLTAEFDARIETSQIASTGDVVSTERFVFPKPRAVVTWSPDDANQLQLRGEREVSQLDFNYFAASGTLESRHPRRQPHPHPAAGLGDRGDL